MGTFASALRSGPYIRTLSPNGGQGETMVHAYTCGSVLLAVSLSSTHLIYLRVVIAVTNV